jgi:tRNA A-37 threonylcarbamoyl transferase component Bud32
MFSEKLSWGAVPDGFRKITDKFGNRLVVRQDREGEIDISICVAKSDPTEQPVYRGRSALRNIKLANGETALIRSYRHGGAFRAITGEHFFTWPPRPFRELSVTEELRRRGFRTVEVYAACVAQVYGPFYKGWLVTKELGGGQDLWAALQTGYVERVGISTVLRAVADTVRSMHREGVYHRDLNVKNILLHTVPEGMHSYIIDFDGARLFLGSLPTVLVKKNLDRLLRSVRKLDPDRKYFTNAAWNEFINFYYESSAA